MTYFLAIIFATYLDYISPTQVAYRTYVQEMHCADLPRDQDFQCRDAAMERAQAEHHE